MKGNRTVLCSPTAGLWQAMLLPWKKWIGKTKKNRDFVWLINELT